jgi:hypothetical protein
MPDKSPLSINFRDFEDIHNHQIDLIIILQAALNSTNRRDAGWFTLSLIEKLATKSYEIGSEAMDKVQTLKPVA